MIKSRNPLFNKTVNKKSPLTLNGEQLNTNKTRRSYFKLSKNNPNLTNIIQNLQKNVKDLKNYHQSLQKTNTQKLLKSNSMSQINKFRCSTKNKIKTFLPTTTARKTNPVRQSVSNKQNRCMNSKDPIVESTVSKYLHQNASTMLSVLNADVDEVKKAYQQTYGKENANIVDLYNFFKKNVQKSTRINGASIQISSYAHGDHSEYLKKSRQKIPRKSNDFLNVIVEDKQQKEPIISSSNKSQNQISQISKISHKNPTIEEIFKNGSPDLANVFDFVKNRRVSLKNYMNINKQKEKTINEKKSVGKDVKNKLTEPDEVHKNKEISLKAEQMIEKNVSSPLFENAWSNNKKFLIEESQLSNKKYLPSKSSKKSQRSSIKKSKQKQLNLDENIETGEINMFNFGLQQLKDSTKQPKKDDNFLDFIMQKKQDESKQMEEKYEKFKKSKYYVDPVPLQRENSLQGCSISLKSSSRIIELDFIPLDL